VILFFGQRWDAPIVDDATPVDTPVGQCCYDCGEPVSDGDRGFIRAVPRLGGDGEPVGSAEPIHAECDLRSVMGHTLGLCRCTGYPSDRATARLVWEMVHGRA
jgi:hypothetical protein